MLEVTCNFEPPFQELQDYAIFETEETTFILGREFPVSEGVVDVIKEFVTSRLWFTYRRNFPRIGGTGPTSDQGWGCMLRCAQMLLGETLIRRHFGRQWMWQRGVPEGDYLRLLRMFQDNKNSLYSIHQIAQMGVSEGKQVGEWFGPNTAAQVLKKLTAFDEWSNLTVHVALDCLLIANDAHAVATTLPPTRRRTDSESSSTHANSEERVAETPPHPRPLKRVPWQPLLLFIPLRLGLTAINRCYLPAIQECFKLEQCVGIIGGRPNHALYFIGITGDKLIYLDPHECQNAVDLRDPQEIVDEDVEEAEEDPIVSLKDEEDEKESKEANNEGDESGERSLATELHLTAVACVSTVLDYVTPIAANLYDFPSRNGNFSTSSNGPKISRTLDDSSYHCPVLWSMNYDRVDPSLALAFYCQTRNDFEQLSVMFKEKVLSASQPPLFEQLERRPRGFPPFVPYTLDDSVPILQEFHDVGAHMVDDDFEVLT